MTTNFISPQPAVLPAPLPTAPSSQDRFLDRLLVRIGDMVLQNATFIMFLLVMGSLFFVLFVGGGILAFLVGERFIAIEMQQQKRIVLQAQLQAQAAELPAQAAIESIIFPAESNESEWFAVLHATAASINKDQPQTADQLTVAIKNPAPAVTFKQSEPLTRRLITADNVWDINCADSGLTVDVSFPCSVKTANINLSADVTVSN